jgi:Protein of unknown function (DUF2778)
LKPPQRLADPADMLGSALASSSPAYASDSVREAALAPVTAPIAAPVVAALPTLTPLPTPAPAPVRRQRIASLGSVPLPAPRPAQIAQIQMRPEPARHATVATVPATMIEARNADLDPRAGRAQSTSRARRSETRVAALAPEPAAPAITGSINPAPKLAAPRLAYNAPDVPAGRDSHTAIYDIVAHTVYLPDGERLEAHSGLGRMLDDPRYASAKGRGPTPPNTYDLTLRSGLFHGVQALRLNPVADSRMYGRDGILAHTYMLGPSGQSFGCVSFKDYSEFLRAFERGEVNRLVVVSHLSEPPAALRASRDQGKRYAFDIRNEY